MKQLQLAYPYLLLAFPVLLLLAALLKRRLGQRSSLLYSTLQPLQGAPRTWRSRLARTLPPLLRWLALACGLLALARPQQIERKQWYESTGVEIAMSVDTSGSMDLLDMDTRRGQITNKRQLTGFFNNGQQVAFARSDTMNRLNVVKQVVKKFISQRRGDRLSVVIFGAQARTLCPLTHDLNAVTQLLDQVEIGMVGKMTDLEKGIRYALKRLIGMTVEDVIELARTRSEGYILEQIKSKRSSFILDKDALNRIKVAKLSSRIVAAMRNKKARSQIMILLTDGQHTAKQGQEGRDDVLNAAREAAMYNIKIYTIGIGSKDGNVYARLRRPSGGFNVVKVRTESFDEDLMREISQLTKGKFFSAQDQKSLQKVYADINKLEPNRFKVYRWDDIKELYLWFLLPMLGLLLLEWLLRETLFRRAP